MQHILITGATGFLGSNIVKFLLKDKKNRLYLLVRKNNNKSPAKRVKKLFKKQAEAIEGDITKPNLGISPSNRKKLISRLDAIYHSAALCEFGVPLEPIRKINVHGAKNVLDFAMKCKKEGRLKHLSHISTVAVSGASGGTFYEDALDIGQRFSNTYERTKFEGEKLIVKYRKKGLSISVFRPSVITGDSKKGEVTNFQMLYQPLHMFALGLFDKIPANKALRYNLVPVDYVARAICLISTKDKNNNRNYHLVNSTGISFDHFLKLASGYFGFKKPAIIDEKKFDYSTLKGYRRKLMDPYLPYLNHKKISFSAKNFKNAVKGKGFKWPKVDDRFLLTLFSYCSKSGYIKRKAAKK